MAFAPHGSASRPADGARSLRAHLAERLSRRVQGAVRFDRLTRALYSTDASIYQIEPLGVVLPRTLDDVAGTMEIARAEGVPVLPRGAGTSQCGQAVARAVVIDASRHLDELVEIDRSAGTAVVEPGLVLDELNRRLAPTGLFFPVDVATASRATLGGMAGNNSGGARSIRYGIMADNVLAIEALLPDGGRAHFGPAGGPDGPASGPGAPHDPPGAPPHPLIARMQRLADREVDELARRVPKVLRHVAGYNLHRLLRPGASPAELLVGSEGTLAFFRRLTLKLSRRPARRVLGVCSFPSLLAALDAVQHLAALDPHAVELMDHSLVALARASESFRAAVEAALPADAHSVLLVEFAGDEDAALSRRLDRLADTVRALGPHRALSRAEDPAVQSAIWAVRRASLTIAMSMKGDRKPVSIVEDCAVPLPALADFGAAVEEVFARHGTSSTWYAHASVGCLHVRPSLDMKDPADIAVFRAVAEDVHEVVRRLGGSHSGEHGDGILRSEFIEPMLGARLARAYREVKDAFDPAGLMNPGRIVDPPRMDDRALFRYAPAYPRSLPVRTATDWSASGGFARAVEACNSNGACRRMDPGVMCPSYRVTREERDSTRGRATALRLAMTGQLGTPPAAGAPSAKGAGTGAAETGLLDHELDAVLELCVGCKACKRECPAGVDMARMKAEVLHLRQQVRRPRRRERIFASLPRWAPMAARLPTPLLNLRNRSRALARLGERTLGIAAGAALPEWSPRPFDDRELAAGPASRGADVVLLADTFSRHFAPRLPRAAARVLRSLGHRPVAPEASPSRRRPLCCGRTYISAGMLDRARAELRRTIAALAPSVRAGAPVVGLEPSCLLTLRDEALHVLPGEDSRAVAERALLLDEFLAGHGGGPGAACGADAAGRPGGAGGPGGGAAPKRTATEPPSPPVARIHAHCHQKAAGTDSRTVRALSDLGGLECVPIQSSCCGMAGSFGYAAEHLRTSRSMGELGLFPAVRSAAPEDVIVANGFSCRAQIEAGTGRRARHMVEVLAERMGVGAD